MIDEKVFEIKYNEYFDWWTWKKGVCL